MCGIAGWVGAVQNGSALAKRMARTLRHRGPDHQGSKAWADAALVHTRLSIIDLSAAGEQPMANEEQSVWTVFNGELYTHKKLRQQLVALGHRFNGSSDTEILPHLYEEYGIQLLQMLRGMFALAIYDVPRRKLLLARDRFGIKPLFYAAGSQQLFFASEIQALREAPGLSFEPDLQSLSDFVALSFVPSPATFYSGVRVLEPGHFLVAEFVEDKVRWATHPFHTWKIRIDVERSLSETIEQAQALLNTAVHRQLESDVPVGCLLSGGIDSSLVSAAAQTGRNHPLRTFNVRFPDSDYDETWAAVAVAKHLGTTHRILNVEKRGGTWEAITDLLLCAGQPFADTSLFAASAICRLMREEVVVALSGDGGDEGFGGYERFRQIMALRLWAKVPATIAGRIRLAIAPFASFGLLSRQIPEHLSALAEADETSLLEYLICWIRPHEHQQLLVSKRPMPVRRLFDPRWTYELPGQDCNLEQLSAHLTEVGIRLSLANDYLFKMDLASMRSSLELRVPMLDEDLFEFATTLPHSMKVKGRFCKRILRALADRSLPPAVARKPKKGFAVPVDTWVDANFKTRLKASLLGPDSGLKELFNLTLCRGIIEAFCSGRPHAGVSREGVYQRVVMLLAVHLALRPDVR